MGVANLVYFLNWAFYALPLITKTNLNSYYLPCGYEC
uniref:Uncharacterized protein n=1 Tax=Arundo donax TaxID=35708 RepID=A0A0A8YKS0_ARUDO